ncbi:hypothetical protein [Bartonella florencae]|nr:hypothetical protein [Bartonella florencae]
MADRASGTMELTKQALKEKQPLYVVALGDDLNAYIKDAEN